MLCFICLFSVLFGLGWVVFDSPALRGWVVFDSPALRAPPQEGDGLKPYVEARPPFKGGRGDLSHHNLLHFHVVAVDESHDIHAWGHVELLLVAAAEGLAAEDASCDVHHLDGGFAFDAEDAQVASAVDEAEAVALDAATRGEHQLKAAGIIRRLRVEVVARVGQQVHIVAGEVIDEVQVAERDLLVGEAQRVAAVLLSLEVDRDFARLTSIDYSVVLVVHRDVHFGVVLAEVELLEGVAFTEADDGVVGGTFFATGADGLGQVDVQLARSCSGSRSRELEALDCVRGLNEDTFHRSNGSTGHSFKAVAFVVHLVVGKRRAGFSGKVGIAYEWVADEVHAFKLDIFGVIQGNLAVAIVRHTSESEYNIILVGIEITLAANEVEVVSLVVAP